MSERKSERDKRGRSVLARCVVICIVAAFIGSLGIAVPGLAAQQTGDTVKVTVNAPEYVEGTFDATIRINNVTDLNAAQFDLSFNSSVMNVTDVRGGEIDGKEVPLYNWDFTDSDTIRVISKLSGVEGANGSGYLAEIEFEVKGKSGENSTLDIFGGTLSNVSAKEIIADWYDTEVTVLRTVVWVEAPEYVNETFNATIKIDTVTDLNSAQFNLSFNSSVVNVTTVRGGEIDGKAVPLYMWDFTDSDTIRLFSNLSAAEGANGSGYLAAVEFEVKGKSGDKSTLNISNGKLVNTTAKEINAGWYDTEVTVLWPTVSVDAPESVSGTFNATIRIANVTNLNTALFDLSFNSSVVNVTTVRGGEIDGKVVPLYTWNFTDSDMITVISNLSAAEGASGAGYLAEIEFEVKGKSGDKSTLNISNGKLVNTKENEINANWYDAEVTVELPNMTVTVTPGTILVSVPTVVTINVTAETTSAPINGATVTLSAGPWSESNTTTNGECTFTVTSPFPGTVNVAVVASGYNDGSADLIVATCPSLTWEIEPPTSVEQDNNVTFDVCFSESASYVISIKNSSGVVVKSWSGTEKDPEPMTWTTTTSDAPGDYTIVITIDAVVVATRTVTVKALALVFDTGEGTYPSIFGTHEGTITPSKDIPVQKMYTYPCIGTGWHTEYVKIRNATGWSTEAAWSGYTGDWHNVVFDEPFTLKSGETYNYTIKTGSYPQIIHEHEFSATGGIINCTVFVDANGRESNEWIPAIKLW